MIAATSSDTEVHLVGHDWGGIQGWEFVSMPRFAGKLASFTTIAGPSLDQIAASARGLLLRGRLVEGLRRVRRSWYVFALCTPGAPTIASSKAAVLMLSECLRADLAPSGIGVTAVCPGIVATNITRAMRYVGRAEADQARLQEYLTRMYQRRGFTAEQVPPRSSTRLPATGRWRS